MTETLTQLQQLAAELPAAAHSSRTQGGKELTYVSIDATINHINDVLGPEWGWNDTSSTKVLPVEKGYAAVCELRGYAVIDGVTKQLYGVGGDTATDLDKAMKTALAEAKKKAFHDCGLALYLWNDETSKNVLRKKALATGTPAARKKAVYEIGKTLSGEESPTAAQVAKALGVKSPADLNDDTVSRRVLSEQGLI